MTTVEVLYFAGCPNAQPAVDRAHKIARAHAPTATVVETLVSDADVQALRFLGSPSIRVDGRDVEPGAEDRTQYGFTCRMYQTRAGLAGIPLDDWIRVALQEASGPPPLLARGRTCGCSPECWCRTGWKRRVRWIWPASHIPM